MIYTRFGGKVAKVLGGNITTGEIDILVDYGDKKPPTERNTYVYELKADGGLNEIEEAIKKSGRKAKTLK